MDLPDRQISIAVELPRLARPSLCLKVTVEPSSMSAAGRHSFDMVPDYPCFFQLPYDDIHDRRKNREILVGTGDFFQRPI